MTDKGKGISPVDALLLLITNLVLWAALVAAVIANAWLPLILVVAASWGLLWYTERSLSPEQKKNGIRFWRK